MRLQRMTGMMMKMRPFTTQLNRVLLEYSKQADSATSSDPLDCIDHEEIFTAIQAGNEDALKVLVQRKEALSNADNKGWIPSHEAAVQHKRIILEITYAGGRDVQLRGKKRAPTVWWD
ncbi:ankyrin repeat and SOCS box protein 15 [Carassius gibelio]|uniref:ankyrin repeat and SOCS box protein 15 n=1 Tax=Carassius gibelio TaxID=101364 RepID=UPI0022785AE9|nr:ankyrin repeat and SOCS box protein 15 [Carassius gibelio]